MSGARDEILGRIRGALGGGGRAAEPAERIAAHPRGPIPARTQGLDRTQLAALFVTLAEAADATISRVAAAAEVPAAVAQFLAACNLPARMVMAPDARLDAYPWHESPTVAIRRGVVEESDAVGVSAAFAAVAETGTLVLLSGADNPTRNNFLPETHVVVVTTDQVVGCYEDAWDRLRAAQAAPGGGFAMPRAVNLITGPSRTADIAQRLELGAHGPRRLHIVLVDRAP